MGAHDLPRPPDHGDSAARYDDNDPQAELEHLRRELAKASKKLDDSERRSRQGEARLTSLGGRLEAGIGGMAEGVAINSAVRDETGRIVDFTIDYVNDALCRTMGLTRKQLVGRRILDVFPGQRANGVFDTYVAVVESGTPMVRDLAGDMGTCSERIHPDGMGEQFDISVTRAGDGYAICLRTGTPRRSVEDALFKSEQMLRLVLDTIPQRVFWKDANSVILGANAAFARDAGFADPAEVVGKTDHDLAWTESADKYVADDRTVMASGQPKLAYDELQPRSGGATGWLRTSKLPLVDKQGRVVGILGTYEDVTEGKQAAEALRDSERLLASIVDNVPDMVFVKDADELKFVRFNRAGERLLGYSREELVGKDDRWLAPGDEAAYFIDMDRQILASGQITDIPEESLTTRDYGRRVLRTRKVPIFDEAGRPKYLLGISEDITDLTAAREGRDQMQAVLRERMRLLTALSEFTSAVNAIREPELMVAKLGDAVNEILPTDTAVITMLDRRDGRYRVMSARGLAPGAVGSIIEPGDGTAGRAISERTVILREHKPGDAYSRAMRDFQLRDTRWALRVPLINEDTVLGVISVGRFMAAARFTESEIDVFALLGSHAALALANAYLIAEVSALAIHDGLTGLYNRRHFDAALDLAIARARRRGPTANVAAIMFDLDHFGDFNRRHGHLAGDAVLRLFAGVLHERLRSSDLVARYGGEEFVVILDDCDISEVMRLADEVRRDLESRSVPGDDGQPLRTSVSAGCAVMDPAVLTKEALIGQADAGLFKAKRAGRNQVVAGPQVPSDTGSPLT